jgi:hypothetical protein
LRLVGLSSPKLIEKASTVDKGQGPRVQAHAADFTRPFLTLDDDCLDTEK